MANSRESSRKPTTSSDGNPCSGSEYHIDVGHNHGQLIAGHNNTITTHNTYNVLMAMVESPRNSQNNNKKRAAKRIKKKNKRQESVESDRSERSKNSETAKGKKFAKNSPRKERVLNEVQSGEESDKEQANHPSLKELKLNDQDFVTTSEDESNDLVSNKHLLTTNDAGEKARTVRYRSQNKENFSIKENFGVSENESKLAYRPKNNTQSGDSFSPFKVALRQAICFAACIIYCLYFEALSFLPFLFWLIFVANNLLACFSCVKFTFKTIDYREIPTYEAHNERPFIAIARLQVDFFIKEENILQRLFALLLCVSLAFVSSQLFGCATCLLMQTIVVSIISTIPYLLFKNNVLLPFPLSEHCRVFKAGLESSGNILY